jgi:hypothetical protein
MMITKSVGTQISAKLGGSLLAYMSKRYVFAVGSLFPLLVAAAALPLFDRPVNAPAPSRRSAILYGEDLSSINDLNRNQSRLDKIKLLLKFAVQPFILLPITVICLVQMVPTSNSIMFYFFTNELKFESGFMGDLKVGANIAHIAGILLFNRYLKTYPFEFVFGCTVSFFTFMNLTQIVLVERWNTQVGISDVIFCFGDTVLGELAVELMMLPKLILLARLCPKSLEGTLFAFFMAVTNIFSVIGRQLASLMTFGLGITAHNFANLSLYILLTSLMKLVPLVLLTRVDTSKAYKEVENKSA